TLAGADIDTTNCTSIRQQYSLRSVTRRATHARDRRFRDMPLGRNDDLVADVLCAAAAARWTWALRRGPRRVRRSSRGSPCTDGRHAVGPGPGGLELGGQPEQRRLVAVPAEHVDADRQPGRVPP